MPFLRRTDRAALTMAVRATILWIIGLVTLVPYGTYYLLYQAAREEETPAILAIAFGNLRIFLLQVERSLNRVFGICEHLDCAAEVRGAFRVECQGRMFRQKHRHNDCRRASPPRAIHHGCLP